MQVTVRLQIEDGFWREAYLRFEQGGSGPSREEGGLRNDDCVGSAKDR